MFSSSSVRAFFHGNVGRRASVGAVAVTGAAFGFTSWSMSNNTSVACSAPSDDNQKRIVIVGGGTAGLGVAAMCDREGLGNKVTLIEPKKVHYYQPLWTLVGGGVKSNQDSVKDMKDVLPRSTEWVQDAVQRFEPENNKVVLQDGSAVEYDYLVVAAGIQSNWNTVPGVKEGLDKPESGVVSVYDYNYSDKVSTEFNRLKETPEHKTMLFTMPPTPIKCAGAPQKIMWLLEDTLRKAGLRDMATIEFWVPGASMFGVKHYADKLEKIRQERGVEGNFKRELVSLDVEKRVATFKVLDGGDKGQQLIQKAYDLIHVVPHMYPPDFIRKSPLANTAGWVEVDKHTLQSPKYDNVFALGDCTSTPNSKTAAAVTSQAPVLVHNLRRVMNGEQPDGQYNGYASCPLILGKKKCMLAEFGYGGKLMETFSRETGSFPLSMLGTEGALQHRFFYFLKEQLFPAVYWHLWTRGYWYGTCGPFKPTVVPRDSPK